MARSSLIPVIFLIYTQQDDDQIVLYRGRSSERSFPV